MLRKCNIIVKCNICFSTNKKTITFFLFVCLMSIIKGMNITCIINILLKYFPNSDWLRAHT